MYKVKKQVYHATPARRFAYVSYPVSVVHIVHFLCSRVLLSDISVEKEYLPCGAVQRDSVPEKKRYVAGREVERQGAGIETPLREQMQKLEGMEERGRMTRCMSTEPAGMPEQTKRSDEQNTGTLRQISLRLDLQTKI